MSRFLLLLALGLTAVIESLNKIMFWTRPYPTWDSWRGGGHIPLENHCPPTPKKFTRGLVVGKIPLPVKMPTRNPTPKNLSHVICGPSNFTNI